jgi:hypothetical protein
VFELSDHDGKLFKMLQEKSSIESYSAIFARFWAFIIGRDSFQRMVDEFPLGGNILDSARNLGTLLADGHDIASTIVVDAFQQFAETAISTQDSPTSGVTSKPLLLFIILSSVERDGRFLNARDITPMLARLKFWMRAICFETIRRNPVETERYALYSFHECVLISLGT